MSSDTENFSHWLNGKLRELNTDESVFGSYINGILEGDESIDDKREALEGILASIIVSRQKNMNDWLWMLMFRIGNVHATQTTNNFHHFIALKKRK